MARLHQYATRPAEAGSAGLARGVSAAFDTIEEQRRRDFEEAVITDEAARKNQALQHDIQMGAERMELERQKTESQLAVNAKQLELYETERSAQAAEAERRRVVTESLMQGVVPPSGGPDDQVNNVIAQANDEDRFRWIAALNDPNTTTAARRVLFNDIEENNAARALAQRKQSMRTQVQDLGRAGALDEAEFWESFEANGKVLTLDDPDFPWEVAEARYNEIVESHANYKEWEDDVNRSKSLIMELRGSEKWAAAASEDPDRAHGIIKRLQWDRNLTDQERLQLHGDLRRMGDVELKESVDAEMREVETAQTQKRIEAEVALWNAGVDEVRQIVSGGPFGGEPADVVSFDQLTSDGTVMQNGVMVPAKGIKPRIDAALGVSLENLRKPFPNDQVYTEAVEAYGDDIYFKIASDIHQRTGILVNPGDIPKLANEIGLGVVQPEQRLNADAMSGEEAKTAATEFLNKNAGSFGIRKSGELSRAKGIAQRGGERALHDWYIAPVEKADAIMEERGYPDQESINRARRYMLEMSHDGRSEEEIMRVIDAHFPPKGSDD